MKIEQIVKESIFKKELPEKYDKIVSCLDTDLTKPMKIQLLFHYLTFLVSQFRIPILFNHQYIPINSICFMFSYSGSGKDTTINILRNLIAPSMNLIKNRIDELNFSQSEQKALQKGDNDLYKYLIETPPFEIGVSTAEGFIQAIENKQKFPIGSINVNTNELLSEISNSSLNILSMLNIVAELYDIGKKYSKQLKDTSKQNKELNNVFINGLFTSSFNLTTDSTIKKRIVNEFQSRFARRSSITFNIVEKKEENIEDIDAWLESKINKINDNHGTLSKVSDFLLKLTTNLLQTSIKYIKISKEAHKVLLLYQQYNKISSKNYQGLQYQFSSLNILNRYWQALKLSGTLAILQEKTEIDKECIITAINIIEIINKDLFIFEKELSKTNYEILVDYCNNNILDNKILTIPIHLLKKVNLISDINKIEDLLLLCNSQDREGIYRYNKKDKNIEYCKLDKCSDYIISCFKGTAKDKQSLIKNLYNKFLPYKIPKEKLIDMLNTCIAYCPYHFKDNIRNQKNLIPITNLLVFDIDDAEFSIQELHNLLKGNLNHLLATTKDSSNEYKYRLLIPLDCTIELEQNYSRLMKYVAREYLLNINYDKLPQCQVFFSYENSKIYYELDSNYIDIKKCLLQIKSESHQEFTKKTTKERKQLLDNKYATFDFAFNSEKGERHKNLIRVINICYDLGATMEEVENLLYEINEFMYYPLDETDLIKTILPHLRKKYGQKI